MKQLSLILSIVLFALVNLNAVHAQGEGGKKGFDKEKLRFGGNVGFNLSNEYLFLEASPTVGYELVKNWTSGLGFIFRYQQIPKAFNPRKFRDLGGLAYTRYQVIPQIFLQANFELINGDRWVQTTDQFGNPTNQVIRRNYESLLLGGGYGSNFGLSIMAFYDVLYDSQGFTPNTGSPLVIRVGFGF